jgi:hypothetical protein
MRLGRPTSGTGVQRFHASPATIGSVTAPGHGKKGYSALLGRGASINFNPRFGARRIFPPPARMNCRSGGTIHIVMSATQCLAKQNRLERTSRLLACRPVAHRAHRSKRGGAVRLCECADVSRCGRNDPLPATRRTRTGFADKGFESVARDHRPNQSSSSSDASLACSSHKRPTPLCENKPPRYKTWSSAPFPPAYLSPAFERICERIRVAYTSVSGSHYTNLYKQLLNCNVGDQMATSKTPPIKLIVITNQRAEGLKPRL